MTLTPDLALEYLTALSADYREGVVLGREDGRRLAGNERLATLARELTTDGEGATSAGKVFAAHSPTHSIVVITGPHALPNLTRKDLRTALSALGAESAQERPLQTIPHATVEALLAASQDSFRPHSAISRSD